MKHKTEIILAQIENIREYRKQTMDLKLLLKNTSWKHYGREMQKINDRLKIIDTNEQALMKIFDIDFLVISEKAENN